MTVRETERQFQKRVLLTARTLGWKVMHVGESTKRVRTKGGGYKTIPDPEVAGWPDLVLAHPQSGRLLFRELKTNTGKLTPGQTGWLELLIKCEEDAGVWRPKDWSRICDELSTYGGTGL